MPRVIAYLKRLSFWRLVATFTFAATLLAEVLIVLQSLLVYGTIRIDLVWFAASTAPMVSVVVFTTLALVVEQLKCAEASRERIEGYLRSMINNMPFLAWLKDRDGRFLAVNKVFSDAAGRADPAAVEGLTDADVWRQELAQKYRSDDRAVMRSGAQKIVRERVSDAGDERWFETFKSPVTDANGEVVGTVGFARDISTEKARELAEQQRNALVREIADALDTHTGEEFFHALTSRLANALGTDFAFVGRYRDADPERVDTLSAICDGKPMENFHYRLQNTPCATTTEAGYCIIPTGVQQAYPKDQMLIDMGVDAYLGVRLVDAEQSPLGLIVVLHRSELAEPALVEDLMRIFAARAAAELERHQHLGRLSFQASHDALTGLANRREFDRNLGRLIDLARDDDSEHAVVFFDLDQFKLVNDTSGHLAGDELLRQIGAMLSEQVRQHDTLARLGGDEFGILFENCSQELAQRKAEDLRALIEAYRFRWDDQVYSVTTSIGVTSITSDSPSNTEVMKQADMACYLSKDAGRNRVHVFQAEDETQQQQSGDMEWANRISDAVETDRFVLYAQPIVPANNPTAFAHYEVLVRMRGDDGETIPPGAFLGAAERYNLATRIDRWVLDQVFVWLAEHLDGLPADFKLSVNLSGQSLSDPAMLKFIIDRLATSPCREGSLMLEVTETAAIANLRLAQHFIAELRARGIGFALDDFGSGLSSFGYLKSLDIAALKIDGQFVRDMLADKVDEVMVRAINDVGQALGKTTVAEFVENDALRERLAEIGVNFVQGYGIGMPRPLPDVVQDFVSDIDVA